MKAARFALGALILASLTLAPTALRAAVGNSVDWQRLSLEEKLQDKITRLISPSLPPRSFAVNVTLELKPAPKPTEARAGGVATSPAAAEDKRVYLGKLETDGPLIGESDEPGAIPLPSVFDSIAQVHAAIFLDKSVPAGKTDLIRTMVTGLIGKVGDQAAEVRVDAVDLIPVVPLPSPTPVAVVAKPKAEPWDLQRWVQEFKYPIGILASTLVFGILSIVGGVVVLGGFRKIEARKVSLLEARNAREIAAEETRAQQAAEAGAYGATSTAGGGLGLAGGPHLAQGSGGDAAGASGPSGSSGAGGSENEGLRSGFDRFKALLRDQPESGGILIKQWTRSSSPGAAAALGVIPQILTADELLALFKVVSENDRREWRRVLTSQPSFDRKLAESFVSSQVINTLLVPPQQEMDDSLREALTGLKLAQCVELAGENPEMGAVLASLLPTDQVGRMLTLLSASQASAVATASLKLSSEELRARADSLKSAVLRLTGKSPAAAPFLARAADLLRELGPAKESTIFEALAEAGEYEILEATARRNFPAELLFNLPVALLKASLERLPVRARAELVIVCTTEQREALLATAGADGSKAREVLDAEIDELEADELGKRRLARNRDKLVAKFLGIVRGLIAGSPQAADQAEAALLEWLNAKSGGKIGGGSADDSQVA